MDVLELKSKIPSRYFDYQRLKNSLSSLTHERRYIGSLIKKGLLIRVKKGLYLWGRKLDQTPYSKEVLANLIYGPSYVSLEWALSFYGLIPERVEKVTSVTCKKKKEFQTPVGDYIYEYLQQESYSRGFRLHIINREQSFLIATPEKALLDLIALRFNKEDFSFSLMTFLEDNLRIDLDEFNKLNHELLLELASHYKSLSVKMFVRLLQKGKN
jgi:hypothetical protein